MDKMPRSPRIHFPGALFHVMARGNAGQRIFFDTQDHQTFLEIVSDVKRRLPFKLFAYCLMPNHFHLLMEMEQFPIWAVMQRIMVRYSKYSNIRRKRFGHVFQARYKPKLCEKQDYLLTLLRYIHRNPIKARLCERPEDWPWSGHGAYAVPGSVPFVDTAFPLSCFGDDPVRARQAYLSFVALDPGKNDEQVLEAPSALPCLGSEEFISEFLQLAQRKLRPVSASAREDLDAVAARVSLRTGLAVEELRSGSRRRTLSEAKRRFVQEAARAGNKQAEIAVFLKCSQGAVSKLLDRTWGETPDLTDNSNK